MTHRVFSGREDKKTSKKTLSNHIVIAAYLPVESVKYDTGTHCHTNPTNRNFTNSVG